MVVSVESIIISGKTITVTLAQASVFKTAFCSLPSLYVQKSSPKKKIWYKLPSHACLNYIKIRVMYAYMRSRRCLESPADNVACISASVLDDATRSRLKVK